MKSQNIFPEVFPFKTSDDLSEGEGIGVGVRGCQSGQAASTAWNTFLHPAWTLQMDDKHG